MRTNELWQDKLQQVFTDYQKTRIDLNEARRRLVDMGMDDADIDGHIEALETEDVMTNPTQTLEIFAAQLEQLEAIANEITANHKGTDFANQLYELVCDSEAMIELYSTLDDAHLEFDTPKKPQYVHHPDTGEVIAQV